jgi:hypothetical protein
MIICELFLLSGQKESRAAGAALPQFSSVYDDHL